MKLKQSACYPAMKPADVPLDEFCRLAAEIGYEAIELWGWDEGLEQVVRTARQAGLEVASITGHESIEAGLNDVDEQERIVEELRRSIDVAARFEIQGVICFSGSRRASGSDLEGLARFVEGARKIVGYAEEKGINLNLEVLNSRLDHPGYQCDRVDWAIAACVAVQSPRLRILFDVYHVQIMEGDVIRGLRRAAPWLGHVHTAGVPGRHELDETQELNYSAIAQALSEIGYDGFVGHELFPTGDWRSALRGAFSACSPG